MKNLRMIFTWRNTVYKGKKFPDVFLLKQRLLYYMTKCWWKCEIALRYWHEINNYQTARICETSTKEIRSMLIGVSSNKELNAGASIWIILSAYITSIQKYSFTLCKKSRIGSFFTAFFHANLGHKEILTMRCGKFSEYLCKMKGHFSFYYFPE